jgi:RimJ/RimL family protein N-acetyltransferase
MPEDLLLFEIKDVIGRQYRVLACNEDRKGELLRFYEKFEPKGEFQGIPPVREKERVLWLDRILTEWQNFIIEESNEGVIIGHIAVDCLHSPSSAELIIFIDQAYRCQGVGTKVLTKLKEILGELRCEQVWVTVKDRNRPAIRCFLKVGFNFAGPIEMEREMICPICKKPNT